MKKILNSFFNSSFFDLVPTILQKRIRKIFKVYFCISNKNKLPKANYNIDFTEKYQKFIVNNFRTKNYISRNSCNYLSKLVSKKKIKKVNFLDFGAGDIIEVETPNGERFMLPFTKRVVTEINLVAQNITVDNLEGFTGQGQESLGVNKNE